ncbi:hypothetical protein AGMMS50256_16730 [Betaproteobacteria bacterium]|nr:hypothetical protein AGMMS50256_16730 [Betaproteobacteria bacterium]
MRTIRNFFNIVIAAGLLLGGPLPSISAVTNGTIPSAYCLGSLDSNPDNPNKAGDIDVIYLNGISNTIEDAWDSRDALASKIISKISPNVEEKIFVGNIYNPTGGLFDFLELQLQGEIYKEAAEQARNETPEYIEGKKKENPNLSNADLLELESSLYLEKLAELQMEKFLQSKNFGEVQQDGSIYDATGNGSGSDYIGPVILNIVATIKERLLAGRRVVIVAHSQGNLFIEAAYTLLKNDLTDDQLKGLQVVGVAVVSPTTPNNKWVTLKQDRAVNTAYPLLGVAFPLGYPNGNFDATAAELWSAPSTRYLAEYDLAIHNFIKIYLNDNIFLSSNSILFPSENRDSTIRRRVEDLVRDAIEHTETPASVISLGAITATLAWTHAYGTDIDLHVIEKFNDGSQDSHVDYSSRQGRIGYLDLDDTIGPGPEHYYTDSFVETLPIYGGGLCSYLQGKELIFGVNPYSIMAPEPGVLNLRVGNTSYSYPFLLQNEDRSTYGKTIFTLKFGPLGTYQLTDIRE